MGCVGLFAAVVGIRCGRGRVDVGFEVGLISFLFVVCPLGVAVVEMVVVFGLVSFV